MKRAVLVLAAAAALAAVAFGVREFFHVSNRTAAILTPTMNVHKEFSGALGPRLYRALHSRPAIVPGERSRLVALTFDDGPYPIFTPLLLDRLRDLHIPATFFLIGRDAEQWPELAQRIETAGNEIGDHTYSHPDLDRETPAVVRSEILRGRDVLWALTHDPSVNWMMRPPHGRYTEQTLRIAQRLGYHVILWTDDSGDWRTIPSARIVAHVEHFATRPDIVLLHNGKLATIEALPAIVEAFRAAGYRFVTVQQLLRYLGAGAVNHPVRRSI
ncbi:MAG TPA: polysaccharide deacetylase family protein [Candidatus Dormibacteraeota bacterium]|nr:polysaccharide deacetylase family protein [Candidatus Dormibacteraeota bacterium]